MLNKKKILVLIIAYNDEEFILDVLKKTQSLRSSHTISTTEEDLEFLKKTGFKKIDIFFKYLNFTGFLVEK